MTTDLIQHAFRGQAVRVITEQHQPWFVLGDVCRVLEIANVSNVAARIDPDALRTVEVIDRMGRTQSASAVSEPGLYEVIFLSRKPEAREFKRWVVNDVLPTIHRYGLYATPDTAEAILADPDVMIRLLTEIKAERAQKATLAAKVEADAPKVLFADAVATSTTDILIRDLAKILAQNGVEVGGNRLFEWLRRDGYLIRAQGRDYNSPTQRAMNLALFRVKETAVTHSSGQVTVSKTPLVTGKGQAYFVSRYAARTAVPA